MRRARVAALQASMQLNEAHRTLKRPVERAEYLLSLEGIRIGQNEVVDPELLGEMLELREQLGEARTAGRTDEVAALRRAMEARRDAALERVAAGFARFEAGGGRGELAAIKEQLILLRYVRRYLDEIARTAQDADPEADA
jgi:Fe-S protein assembly co-chaperone HscB